MVLSLGQVGTASAVYISVLAVMLFPARVAIVLVLADAVLVFVLGEVLPDWTSAAGWPLPSVPPRWPCSASSR